MALGFWNVRGLNDDLRRSEVKLKIKKFKLDLFALFETKIREMNFDHKSKCFGSNFRVASNGNVNENGDTIWLCWNDDMWEVDIVKIHEQYIHAFAKNRGGLKIFFTAIYGSSKHKNRKKLSTQIINLSLCMHDYPWIVGGDFNEVLRSNERIGPGAKTRWARMEEFGNCINSSNLIELESINGNTSWNNGRMGGGRVISKLHRRFVNQEWIELWPHAKLDYHPGGRSDHDILTIDLRIVQETETFQIHKLLDQEERSEEIG